MKQVVGKIIEVQEGKIGQKEFAQYTEKISSVLDLIKKDMILKASIKDVCTILDTKASTDSRIRRCAPRSFIGPAIPKKQH